MLLIWFSQGAIAYGDEDILTFSTSHFPPYSIEGDGGNTGFIIDLVRDSFAAVDVKAEVQIYPWARAKMLAETGQVAGSFKSSKSEALEEIFLFSDSFNSIESGFFISNLYKGPEITGLNSLKGLNVIANQGYSISKLLTENGIDHSTVVSEKSGVLMLYHKRVDVYVGYKAPINYVAEQNHMGGRFGFVSLKKNPYYLIVNKDYPNAKHIRDMFNEGIQILKKNGRYDAIMASY